MSTPPAQGTPPPHSTPPAPSPEPRRDDLLADVLVRVGGAVVAIWGGILLGLYATFMTPFRIGTALVPISIALAVVGNAGLVWFAYLTTRNKFVALLPGLVWAVLSFMGSARTTEGDLVLYQSNWVGTVYLFAGSITVGVAAYRIIVPKPPPIMPRD